MHEYICIIFFSPVQRPPVFYCVKEEPLVQAAHGNEEFVYLHLCMKEYKGEVISAHWS